MKFRAYPVPIVNTMSPNVVAITDTTFHLSYKSSCSDYGSDTTAIVLRNNVFFILNGDHKEALLALAETEGLPACMQYFIEHIAQANPLSEHRMAVLLDADMFGLNKTVSELLNPEILAAIRNAAEALCHST